MLNTQTLQIVFREDFGTEGRGGYFDQYGYVQAFLSLAKVEALVYHISVTFL